MKVSVPVDHTIDLSTLFINPKGNEIEFFGKPQLKPEGIMFGGSDGLLIHHSFLPEVKRFDITIRFKPFAQGPWQQRFFHIQDLNSQDRFLMEIRMESDGTWYADTFFQSGNLHCILQDPGLRFPADQWYDYQVTYDGSILKHKINGEGVLSATLEGGRLPQESGCALGVRWNKIYPFVGVIQSVRLRHIST